MHDTADLQRFHFWCLQSNRAQRGFSPRNRGPRQARLLGCKKSRTSLPCPVQSRSENALNCAAERAHKRVLQNRASPGLHAVRYSGVAKQRLETKVHVLLDVAVKQCEA